MNKKFFKLLLLGNTLMICGSILTGFGAPEIAEIIINFPLVRTIYLDITYIGIPSFIIGLVLSIISIIKGND